MTELVDNGDLAEKIEKAKKTGQRFSEGFIWSVFLQVSAGLRELHSKKIAHRDVKPANIFLCKDGTVKLADMNVSKVMKRDLLKTQTGTPMYASPEVWDTAPYDLRYSRFIRSDIWSLGCVIYELAALKAPFEGSSLDEVYNKVKQCLPDHIPRGYSEKMQTIIMKLIKRSSGDRITMGTRY